MGHRPSPSPTVGADATELLPPSRSTLVYTTKPSPSLRPRLELAGVNMSGAVGLAVHSRHPHQVTWSPATSSYSDTAATPATGDHHRPQQYAVLLGLPVIEARCQIV
jgi:hypothetical protein